MSNRTIIIILIIAGLLGLYAFSSLSGTSEICAYYGFNLPECK